MNPLYQQLQQPMQLNPMQRMGELMNAMRNPAAFVRQQFPDIPNDISNNPQQILGYLQQTRGIPTEQIQQLMGLYGHMFRP